MIFIFLRLYQKGLKSYNVESDYIDDYQCIVLRDEEFIKGNFYLRDNIYDMIFIFDVKRIIVVYVVIVRYICGELIVKKKGRKIIYKILLKENEEIIVFF